LEDLDVDGDKIQDRQRMFNVILSGVRVAVLAVEDNYVLRNLS